MRYIRWRSSALRQTHGKEFERNAVTAVAILIDAQEQFVSKTLLSNLEYQVQAAASVLFVRPLLFAELCRRRQSAQADQQIGGRRQTGHPLQPGRLETGQCGSAAGYERLAAHARQPASFCLSWRKPGSATSVDSLLVRMDVRWCLAPGQSFSLTREKDKNLGQRPEKHTQTGACHAGDQSGAGLEPALCI